MSDGIRPVHHKLEIVPDLGQFRFSGRATVDLEADQPVSQVELNLRYFPTEFRRHEYRCGWVAGGDLLLN